MLYSLNAKLLSKKDLTHDVMLLRFQTSESVISAISGQYMIVHVPREEEVAYRRLYSIASDCSNIGSIEIVAKIIPGGAASEYFKKLTIGEVTKLEGPAGVFHLKNNAKDKMFLATGTGIAPIKAMIHELLEQKDKITGAIHLLWGLRFYKDVYFLDELKKWSQEFRNFTFKICLSREELLDHIPMEDRHHFSLGRIARLLDEGYTGKPKDISPADPQKLANTDIYLCGDRAVVESLRQYLYGRGFSRDAVIFEKF